MGFMDILIYPPEEEKEIFTHILKRTDSKLENQNSITVSSFLDLVNQGYFKDTSVHEFLEKCKLDFYLPPPEPRNPELEKRITKLKAEQANAEYRLMTKNLFPVNRNNISLRDDVKAVTSQLTAVLNFVFAVAGSFFFAYKAVEYALPEPNIPAQVMMGIITSITVALADLYFLLRTI